MNPNDVNGLPPATQPPATQPATTTLPAESQQYQKLPVVKLQPGPRLSWWLRWFNGLMGLAVCGVFAIAVYLIPSPDGMGTHQQLGLPPCTTVALFGVRCPSCGMTTSWSLFVRGHWLESVQVNTGGFMLALIALAYLPASCYLCIGGRSTRGGWLSLSLAIGLALALVVALVQWAWRLTMG